MSGDRREVVETIAAIATPLGEGGLAVIRVSGPRALALADGCFRPAGRRGVPPSRAASHTIHYGHVHRDGARVDEVLLSVFRAPRSFTREDVVEISCHGGILTAKLVLDAVLHAGGRLAHPGEFTLRAFLGGRIDLAQAEAVTDVIHARTERALRAAQAQLEGALSRRTNGLRDELMRVLAHVEAHLDFPDEDIAPDTREQLLAALGRAGQGLDEILRRAPEGRLLRRGVRVALVGRPNVGKSSLLNLLLGHDRAIVSPEAGTTRDTIEDTANVRGVPVIFVDTAGVRAAGDGVEAEGIRRSKEMWAQAELVLWVVDGSEAWVEADAAFLREAPARPTLIVRNKVDLPVRWQRPETMTHPVVDVSCRDGSGLESLREAIVAMVWSGEVSGSMDEAMINARHEDALRRARLALTRGADALLQGVTLECAALDLRLAVQAVGEVVGKTTTEDLLDSIFSQFCLGK